jgi:arylsulfatase
MARMPDKPSSSGRSRQSPRSERTHALAFTGEIKWIRLDVGTDSHDHLIDPEQLMHFAMSRQ